MPLARQLLWLALTLAGASTGAPVLVQSSAPIAPAAQASAPTKSEAPAAAFPAAWAGRWKGEVRVLGAPGQTPTFTMERVIGAGASAGRWQWTIIYDGAAGRQERAYELVADDEARGLFTVDEKNGIKLPARFIEGVLYSTFEVQGNRISMREELQSPGTPQERLLVELQSHTADSAVKSGGGEVPEVLGWTPVNVQKASLERLSASTAAGEQPTGSKPEAKAEVKPESKPAPAGRAALPVSDTEWKKLATEPYRGKQDDIFFVSPTTGWYANGAGKLFKTTDAGATWTKQLDKPGTYWRCLAFVNENLGFAGNIGPGYFPNVSDTTPLYRTRDGGATWEPVTTISGDPIVGLCAIEIVRTPFVNAGNLSEKTRIVAVGRVGGPAAMIVSDDLGETWSRVALPDSAKMAFDVHFFDAKHGVIASASSENVEESNALILTTDDGGATWREAYRSPRPWELTWKISFPSRNVGYVTVQSYNPNPEASARFVAKTVDGGKTWTEIPLVDDPAVRQFGVAFIDEQRGFVGAMPGGFETTDGGATWKRVDFGNAVNKIRILESAGRRYLHAIGVQVHRLELPASK
ncbi:MAG: hypothetical protein SFY95_05195 [Planctomycetota bacterium]|nr:hypothetical protein [Planctomycetota bacterium]